MYLPMSRRGRDYYGDLFAANACAISSLLRDVVSHLYAAQLVAISFGTYLNYSLNKLFTWRSDDKVEAAPGVEAGQGDGPVSSQ